VEYDVWSMGCTAVQLLTGTRPCDGLNLGQIMTQVGCTDGRAEPLRPDVPHHVPGSQMLRRCFELRRSRPHAKEVAVALEPYGMEAWPFDRLDLSCEAGRNGSAVLLMTGAMNPAQKGHIEVLKCAQERLEAEGIAVLGAYLSPSSDPNRLSNEFRLQVLCHLVADKPRISVGAWEAKAWEARKAQGFGTEWPDFPEVIQALQGAMQALSIQRLNEHRAGEIVRVFYVCGSDMANQNRMLWSVHPSIAWDGVVVVPRAGGKLEGQEDISKCCFVARPASVNDTERLSFAELQEALQNKDRGRIEKALDPRATTFLLAPSAEEFEHFRSDYMLLGVNAPA